MFKTRVLSGFFCLNHKAARNMRTPLIIQKSSTKYCNLKVIYHQPGEFQIIPNFMRWENLNCPNLICPPPPYAASKFLSESIPAKCLAYHSRYKTGLSFWELLYFSHFWGNYIFFSFSLLRYFGKIYIWPTYHIFYIFISFPS